MAFKEVVSERGCRRLLPFSQASGRQRAACHRNAKRVIGEETVLVDQHCAQPGFSTAVSIVAISRDARFLAYSVRQGGTDHSALEIFDIERNTVLADRLPEGFCTGFVFVPDGTGFYYSHRELRDPRPIIRRLSGIASAVTDRKTLKCFSRVKNRISSSEFSIRSKPISCVRVFSAGKHPTTSIYLHSLEPGAAPRLLLRDIEGCFAPFFAHGQLFAYTDYAAPNFRIVGIDLDDPDPMHCEPLSPRLIAASSSSRLPVTGSS